MGILFFLFTCLLRSSSFGLVGHGSLDACIPRIYAGGLQQRDSCIWYFFHHTYFVAESRYLLPFNDHHMLLLGCWRRPTGVVVLVIATRPIWETAEVSSFRRPKTRRRGYPRAVRSRRHLERIYISRG